MSTEQRSLGDYGNSNANDESSVAEPDEPAQRPAWAPDEGATTGGRCRGCESHVTAEFARVMGDNHGQIHACPQCAKKGALARGAAANPDYEPRVDNEVTWR